MSNDREIHLMIRVLNKIKLVRYCKETSQTFSKLTTQLIRVNFKNVFNKKCLLLEALLYAT
jgi:hypothetical protein